jgi:hypothetical protein
LASSARTALPTAPVTSVTSSMVAPSLRKTCQNLEQYIKGLGAPGKRLPEATSSCATVINARLQCWPTRSPSRAPSRFFRDMGID